MRIRHLHHWSVSFHEAVEIQNSLRKHLNFKNLPDKITLVAGTDASYSRKSDTIWAGVIVLKYPSLEKVEERWVKGKTSFPYKPGLLSFREIPFLMKAIKLLEREPDLFFCDGQGIAHPRGLGLASHLGLLVKTPTIGCAKKLLVGEFSEVGFNRGDYSIISYQGKAVGVVVRTRTGVRPIFVSPGYQVTIRDAMRMVLDCGGAYRIPEPVRQAHLLVNRIRQRAC